MYFVSEIEIGNCTFRTDALWFCSPNRPFAPAAQKIVHGLRTAHNIPFVGWFTKNNRVSFLFTLLWKKQTRNVSHTNTLILDTPCTAGARRRRNWWILPWLQHQKSPDLPLFDGPTPDHVRTLFSRVQKWCPKIDPNLWAFAKDMYTVTTYFQLS